MGAGDRSRGCCKRIIKSIDHGLQGREGRKEMGGAVMVGEKVGKPLGGGFPKEPSWERVSWSGWKLGMGLSAMRTRSRV